MLAHDREGVVALPRHAAGQHLEKHDADGVDVRSGVAALALDLLGRHVVGRAERRGEPAPGEPSSAGHEGHAEVGHDQPPVRGHEHVLGLEVAMEDALRVGVSHRRRQLPPEIDRPVDRQALLAVQVGAQRLAVDVLHDHVRAAAIRRELDRALDARVVEVARDLELAPEPVEGRDVAHDRLVRALEDDLAAGRILGQEDVAERALADRPHDRELIELRARLEFGRGHENNLRHPCGASGRCPASRTRTAMAVALSSPPRSRARPDEPLARFRGRVAPGHPRSRSR